MSAVAKPFVAEQGRPQGRAPAFPQDQNKGGVGRVRTKTKNPIRGPKVSKLHLRDAGPLHAETSKKPSRERTPKGGGGEVTATRVVEGGKKFLRLHRLV